MLGIESIVYASVTALMHCGRARCTILCLIVGALMAKRLGGTFLEEGANYMPNSCLRDI